MLEAFLRKTIKKQWYARLTWFWLLLPFEIIFRIIVLIRKILYKIIYSHSFYIPIWVVGDITVGGSGKSPFVIWLVKFLHQHNIRVIVINHGYKSNMQNDAATCLADSDPAIFGDEAVMLAKVVCAPIVVAKTRLIALSYIGKHYQDYDLIICDDGLQDYTVKPEKKIIIFNKNRLGNKHCFPVGPLREPVNNVTKSSLIVKHNSSLASDMHIHPNKITNIITKESFAVDSFYTKEVHAVCAIADPERFFKVLANYNFNITSHSYPDHYSFTKKDLQRYSDQEIIMTTKDAVKCMRFGMKNIWQLEFEVKISARVERSILEFISNLKQ